MRIKPEYLQRARRGRRFLDVHRPGWRQRVDPDRLFLSSPWSCVLAQVEGQEFASALQGLDLSSSEAADLGFTLFSNKEEPSRDPWGSLEAAWRQVLKPGK